MYLPKKFHWLEKHLWNWDNQVREKSATPPLQNPPKEVREMGTLTIKDEIPEHPEEESITHRKEEE